jgi:hypothetical protein
VLDDSGRYNTESRIKGQGEWDAEVKSFWERMNA